MESEAGLGQSVSDCKVILLDIEGTTTPVSFVYDVLFPYARDHLARFLELHFDAPEVANAVGLIREEHGRDSSSGKNPPAWDNDAGAVAAYCAWLMGADRKATGLKAIQGLIWKDGYENGDLKATLYDDVPPAFERWRARGARIFIYSSGSVLAQKLLFSHSSFGDVTPLLSGYYDTQVGAKMEAESYHKICLAAECEPGEMLFLSDSVAELDAAKEAGLGRALVVRDHAHAPENPGDHPVISDFDPIE